MKLSQFAKKYLKPDQSKLLNFEKLALAAGIKSARNRQYTNLLDFFVFVRKFKNKPDHFLNQYFSEAKTIYQNYAAQDAKNKVKETEKQRTNSQKSGGTDHINTTSTHNLSQQAFSLKNYGHSTSHISTTLGNYTSGKQYASANFSQQLDKQTQNLRYLQKFYLVQQNPQKNINLIPQNYTSESNAYPRLVGFADPSGAYPNFKQGYQKFVANDRPTAEAELHLPTSEKQQGVLLQNYQIYKNKNSLTTISLSPSWTKEIKLKKSISKISQKPNYLSDNQLVDSDFTTTNFASKIQNDKRYQSQKLQLQKAASNSILYKKSKPEVSTEQNHTDQKSWDSKHHLQKSISSFESQSTQDWDSTNTLQSFTINRAPQFFHKIQKGKSWQKVYHQQITRLAEIGSHANSQIKKDMENVSRSEKKEGQVILNIGKFQDSINIHTQNIQESTNQLEQKISSVFLKILKEASHQS